MQENRLNLEQVQAIAEHVVATARQVDVDLDYTGATLPYLEQYIAAMIQVYGGLTALEADDKLLPLALGFALYFGETVRRSIGGEWVFQAEERMTTPFIHFDQAHGSANTANLNVIATLYDFMRAPDEHAIVYSYVTYEKIYRGLAPYDIGQGKPSGNGHPKSS